MGNIVLVDFDLLYNRVLTRYKSIFLFRNGILLPLHRILKLDKQTEEKQIIFFHLEPKLEKLFSFVNQWQPFSELYPDISSEIRNKGNKNESLILLKELLEESKIYTSLELDIISSLDNIEKNINFDLQFLSREEYNHYPAEIQYMGNKSDIWIHPSVVSTYGVVLNAKTGPIVIDKNCSLTAFTYIEGPFYSGENCRLDNVRITGGVVLGKGCRVSGEIENSIFGDFSNKHHEGFVGHSLIGDWVNLGAITTTSDLKNNYGEVRLHIPLSRIPQINETPISVSTNRIKFGSIIGDCVKTSIGTMFNTGTVIDIGCNVFGGNPPSYLHPFSWGIRGHRYELDRFLKDCEKIFARRSQKMDSHFIELTKYYYSKTI
ncbi:MAG: glucose-1-phosphate thymidylyltransferase [Leptonema sp. (in: bacteria)]